MTKPNPPTILPSPPPIVPAPPTPYSQEVADEICRRIADDKSLTLICKDPEMPAKKNVALWIRENKDGFGDRYARAKRDSAHATYTGIQDIEQDVIDKKLDAQQARVIIDSRKWRAGKMKPKVYGDKLDVAVTGKLSLTSVIADLDKAGDSEES